MPELPEVDAVARRLGERTIGRTILQASFTRKQTTQPVSARTLAPKLRQRVIESVSRRAKNILIGLSGGDTLRVHLGMTGNLYAGDDSLRSKATRARFALDDGREILFDDSRLFGRIHLLNGEQLQAFDQGYGVEPLSPAFTKRWLTERAAKSRRPSKIFLMDQTEIVGLGNIWAAEALFESGIAPARPMDTLDSFEVGKLRSAIRRILSHAVREAYRYYDVPGATPESEGFGVAVYNRGGLPCLRCRGEIRRTVQGGRSTYFCPRCQS